jgi:hypothetical protein
MNVLINHCWCSDSIWGGVFNCRVIVSIDRVPEGKTYYDVPEPDWTNLLTKHSLDPDEAILFGHYDTYRLKPEVTRWLNENVKDRVEPCEGCIKSWAVGTDKYNSNSGVSFTLFFDRQPDAMKFIKHWSSHMNAVNYLNYFKDIRRKLNVKTGRLVRVPRWKE